MEKGNESKTIGSAGTKNLRAPSRKMNLKVGVDFKSLRDVIVYCCEGMNFGSF